MLAKKCDLCGSFYECYHGELVHVKKSANCIILADVDDAVQGYYERKHIELCPRCLTKFQSWMTEMSKGGISNAK